LISGPLDRRRRALFFSTLASAAFHLIFLAALFYAVAHVFIARGAREVVSQATIATIRRPPPPTPKPTPPHKHITHPVHARQSAPAAAPYHELAKQIANAPPQPPPPRHRPTLQTRIERDANGYANEVAQLNKQDDPHSIPTIDPSSRGSSTKSYSFDVASLNSGDEHGNGIITPTQSWHAQGEDCYYGRYEFTYPDGAMETGNIVWPFCYDPGSDPFKLPPHPMPFPLPLPGFKLPADTQLPPIEKQVYDEWAGNGPPQPASTP
jgi:hypothetical protein